ALAQPDGRAQAFVPERRRKPDVDDCDIRLLEQDRARERVAVGHRRDDVEAVVAQQPRQPVAQQREILRDHDPHGITALIVVGPPAGLVTSSDPSSASTRRRSPASPLPVGSAPPLPSSTISTTSLSPSRRRSISTWSASAYLPVFARASATTKYAAVST